jgi:lipopolysaccharide assembly outer membrane protein LptD (OstA)
MIKKLLIAGILIILLAFAVYVVIASGKIDLIQTFIPEKIAVFRNVHMTGTEGDDSWEMSAAEGWTDRDRRTTTFEFITADINKAGRPLIKGLSARRLRVSVSKDIEILKKDDLEKNGRQYLSALVDFNAISNKKKKRMFSSLTADSIKFNPDTKKALITGGVTISKDKLLIRSEAIALDMDKNIATFESRSSFSGKGSKLTANSSTAFFDEDKIYMEGSVEVRQKNKTAVSDKAVYDDKTRTVLLSSNVRAVIKKLNNMIKEKSAKKIKGEEARKALQEATVITCDDLKLSEDKGDCVAYGRVFVLQKEREARSDRAVYSEDGENIVMTGNVYMKRKDDWVRANKVIVSVDKETFEAIGGVETTFKVKKGSRR